MRLRILLALAPERRLTIGEISQCLPDIPPATLYRHVNKLAKSHILRSVDKRRVRSALEHVYQLVPGTAVLGPQDMSKGSRGDQLRYFTTFVATLLANYARYLERDTIDLQKDGVGYRHVPIQLSDDEVPKFTAALRAVIEPYLADEAAPYRSRRIFSTILMPDAAQAPKSP